MGSGWGVAVITSAGCVFIANNIISSLNGKVVTTSLNGLLRTENCGIAVRGFSPCVGVSPNALGPCRRKRYCIAMSKRRTSLSLKRCRHFLGIRAAHTGGVAANHVCRDIVGGRHGKSCLKGAIRIIPRVASRVGHGIGLLKGGCGFSFIVARVKNAINSVRSLPFVRDIHRLG